MRLPCLLDGETAAIQVQHEDAYGMVFVGQQGPSKARVSIRLIDKQLASDTDWYPKLSRRMAQLAELHHPGMCEVLGLRRSFDGTAFMVSECLDGGTMHALRAGLEERGRRLPDSIVFHVVKEIATALAFTHDWHHEDSDSGRVGVHGDLSPQSIFVTPEGGVKLGNLGLGFCYREYEQATGRKLGALPRCAGPEYFESPGYIVAQSDVYALAATYLDLLTNHSIYSDDVEDLDSLKIAVREFHLTTYCVLHDVPHPLQSLLQPALEASVRDRVRTMNDFLAMLESYGPTLNYNRAEAMAGLARAAQLVFRTPDLRQHVEEPQAKHRDTVPEIKPEPVVRESEREPEVPKVAAPVPSPKAIDPDGGKAGDEIERTRASEPKLPIVPAPEAERTVTPPVEQVSKPSPAVTPPVVIPASGSFETPTQELKIRPDVPATEPDRTSTPQRMPAPVADPSVIPAEPAHTALPKTTTPDVHSARAVSEETRETKPEKKEPPSRPVRVIRQAQETVKPQAKAATRPSEQSAGRRRWLWIIMGTGIIFIIGFGVARLISRTAHMGPRSNTGSSVSSPTTKATISKDSEPQTPVPVAQNQTPTPAVSQTDGGNSSDSQGSALPNQGSPTPSQNDPSAAHPTESPEKPQANKPDVPPPPPRPKEVPKPSFTEALQYLGSAQNEVDFRTWLVQYQNRGVISWGSARQLRDTLGCYTVFLDPQGRVGIFRFDGTAYQPFKTANGYAGKKWKVDIWLKPKGR